MERTTTSDETIGASIVHPAGWAVGPERHTYADTYGFTLWKPNPHRLRYHGGSPVARVALAYGLQPEQIESKVQDKLDAYSDLPMAREEVRVGGRRLRGVAVGPIPGSTPSTEVYVAVDDERVYQLNVYGERLDTEERKLLSSLRFEPPSRSIESLRLLDATAPEAFTVRDEQHVGLERFVKLGRFVEPERLVEFERSAQAEGRATQSAEATLEMAAVRDIPEVQLRDGCWRAASSFFVQTQHGWGANARWGPEWTGWTIIGSPNYWGQYTHGSLGYGRCVSDYYTNDMYAIDYPLDWWDVVFSPFASGTVTFAGRNASHINYGIFVVIQADNEKYVSMSAHLIALNEGIFPGATVTDETIIGFAGDTGDPWGTIPVGPPHLHQAFYRFPSLLGDGSPYGGTGLQVIYHHYVGTAAGTGPGVYKFGWQSNATTWAQYDAISN